LLEKSAILFGGDGEDRTRYLLNAIQALSQLSYIPKCKINDSINASKVKFYLRNVLEAEINHAKQKEKRSL
jgi:hypothetical protein